MLDTPLAWLDGLDRAKRPARVPSVLKPEELRSPLYGRLDRAEQPRASYAA